MLFIPARIYSRKERLDLFSNQLWVLELDPVARTFHGYGARAFSHIQFVEKRLVVEENILVFAVHEESFCRRELLVDEFLSTEKESPPKVVIQRAKAHI